MHPLLHKTLCRTGWDIKKLRLFSFFYLQWHNNINTKWLHCVYEIVRTYFNDWRRHKYNGTNKTAWHHEKESGTASPLNDGRYRECTLLFSNNIVLKHARCSDIEKNDERRHNLYMPATCQIYRSVTYHNFSQPPTISTLTQIFVIHPRPETPSLFFRDIYFFFAFVKPADSKSSKPSSFFFGTFFLTTGWFPAELASCSSCFFFISAFLATWGKKRVKQ